VCGFSRFIVVQWLPLKSWEARAPKAAGNYTNVITWLSLALISVLLATSNLITPFYPFWAKGPDLEDRDSSVRISVYGSAAITLSAPPTSDAAWEGDNAPELSKSFTSLMNESRFPIAPAFFPAFIMFIAC
jgi:hypothetical protein